MRNYIPEFPHRLREHRERCNLTIDELAVASGIHRDSIAKLERSERSPTLRVALDLASALGVTLDALVAPGPMLPGRGRGRVKKTSEKLSDSP